jgi:hypothetical protein
LSEPPTEIVFVIASANQENNCLCLI